MNSKDIVIFVTAWFVLVSVLIAKHTTNDARYLRANMGESPYSATCFTQCEEVELK